ncbi:unnamed protein product [Closterium sp. NIES-65]|nr:unnamed protein product [Closterium sp. NIES-65]
MRFFFLCVLPSCSGFDHPFPSPRSLRPCSSFPAQPTPPELTVVGPRGRPSHLILLSLPCRPSPPFFFPFPHSHPPAQVMVVEACGRVGWAVVACGLSSLSFPPFPPLSQLTVVEARRARKGDGGGGARSGGLGCCCMWSLISFLSPLSPLPPTPQVTVVEARGRVGGRMWSRTEAAPAGSPTAFLRGEMGAQWIEGATGNPIAALARKFKLRIGRQNGREIQFTAKGKRYRDPGWSAAEAEYQTLVRQGLSWANRQDKDVSLQQAFTSGPWKRRVFLKPYVQSRLSVDFEFDFAAPLSRLSAWYFDSLAFKPPTVVVTNGYDNIPKMLMQEAVAAGAVLTLNFEVTAISQSSTGVQITGKDTATDAITTLDADVVIVTIPLGVLKANTIAFSPSLPPRKTGAIARLGVGAIAKIFFFFNQTFWPVNVDEYFIEDAQLPANRGRWVDWVNLKRAWGQTALEGVALGEYAERMATMSDEEVINDAKAKMARMFPQYRKKPVEALATWIQRWTAEPYSRGAYSYARVGVRGNEDHCTDYDVMALPEGRVLFAGEHTIWQYQATVHGALLSGVREGKRVLKNF